MFNILSDFREVLRNSSMFKSQNVGLIFERSQRENLEMTNAEITLPIEY